VVIAAVIGPMIVAVTGTGCDDRRSEVKPVEIGSLEAYLASVARADEAARQREIARWQFDEPAWRRTVVEPYRTLHAEYVAAWNAAMPSLVARLAAPGTIETRPHFAGDPRLTPAQARARWALPVGFASQVASQGGVPIDLVFVRDGDRWRAITGLDRIIRSHVAALDTTCASVLDLAAPPPRCRDLAWEIADAALRTDRARFAHACSLAASHCATP